VPEGTTQEFEDTIHHHHGPQSVMQLICICHNNRVWVVGKCVKSATSGKNDPDVAPEN
jgi:hypothetical protein